MSSLLRKQIPIALVFVTTSVFLVNFFVTETTALNEGESRLTDLGTSIFAFTTFLVTINLFLTQGKQVARRTKGTWHYSLLSIAVFLMFVIFAYLPGYTSTKHPLFDWTYRNMYYPLSATMNGILAFSNVGGAIRAFRARNLEATVLLLAAMFAWMATAPVGELINPILPGIGNWFIDVPNTAANRGLLICVAVGAIALGIRQMTGMERAYLGITEEG